MAELLIFILFLAGIAMKLLHIPLHTIVMFAALGAMLVMSIIRIVRNKPGVKRTAGWLGIATVSWLVFFLFEVKFFGGTLILMAAALFVSVISLLMTLFEPGALPGGRIFVLLTALALAATTSWMTPHSRYYVYNIRFNKEAMKDHRTLDKYSWFLYLGQQYDEALRISRMAFTLAKNNGDREAAEEIAVHTQAIRERTWQNFN